MGASGALIGAILAFGIADTPTVTLGLSAGVGAIVGVAYGRRPWEALFDLFDSIL